MNVYKWKGRGHYLPAVLIVVADCIESAREMIEMELINSGLENSWKENKEIEEFEINDCRVIHFSN